MASTCSCAARGNWYIDIFWDGKETNYFITYKDMLLNSTIAFKCKKKNSD